MKENVKNKILAASRDKVSRLNDLRAKKTINDTEYQDAINAVNSNVLMKEREIDTKYNNTILAVMGKQVDTAKADQAALASGLADTAKAMGLSADQVGLLAKYFKPGMTPAEAYNAAVKSNDPDIKKAIDENRAAANQAENAKIQLEQMKIQIDSEANAIKRDGMRNDYNAKITEIGQRDKEAALRYGYYTMEDQVDANGNITVPK